MHGRAVWLADVLRGAGLHVVEYQGWQDRGRPFPDLRAVVWHHDASPPGDSPGVPAYMLRESSQGRSWAQLWVDRAGRWHVLGAGVAAHAGRVRAGMPGNGQSLGVETDHTTGERWPQQQLDGLRRGTAAILARLGQRADALHFHKTVCSPPGRKTDPDGLDLAAERQHVARLHAASSAARRPAPEEQEDSVEVYRDGSDLVVWNLLGRRRVEDAAELDYWRASGRWPDGEVRDLAADPRLAQAVRRLPWTEPPR